MILAFDLSLISTGYYILSENKPIKGGFLTSKGGVIKSSLKEDARLYFIEQRIDLLLKTHKPDLVVIEGYSFGSRGRATFSSGELGGVIRLLLFRKKIPYLVVAPTSLKKFISGKGNSSKDMMLLKTYKKYGIEFDNNNICDAFGLAMIGKAWQQGTNIQYEKDVLKAIIFYSAKT